MPNTTRSRLSWRRVSHYTTHRRELMFAGERLASVYFKEMDGVRLMPPEKQGYYFVARSDGYGVPYANTSNKLLYSTEKEAEEAALAYVKEHLK